MSIAHIAPGGPAVRRWLGGRPGILPAIRGARGAPMLHGIIQLLDAVELLARQALRPLHLAGRRRLQVDLALKRELSRGMRHPLLVLPVVPLLPLPLLPV